MRQGRASSHVAVGFPPWLMAPNATGRFAALLEDNPAALDTHRFLTGRQEN